MKNFKVFIVANFLLCVLRAQEPKLILPIGHTAQINSASFSPDGKYIVTASSDGTAKIWNAQTGNLLIDLKGLSKFVNSAVFSPDGKYIVTASGDGTVKVWNAQTGNLFLDLKGHLWSVSSASYSPDGKYIVTASADSTVKVWNAKAGNLIMEIKKNFEAVYWASYSPDGKYIVTTSGTLRVLNARTGDLIMELKEYLGTVYSTSYSPDGKYILTASSKNVFVTDSSKSIIKVWNAQTGDLVMELKENLGEVYSASYSPDGKYIVTGSFDSTAKVWNAQTGNLVMKLRGHLSSVNSAEFSPDGKYIVTASWDGKAKVWNAQTGNLLVNLKGVTEQVNSASFSPDAKYILTILRHTAKVWNTQTGNLLISLKGITENINSASYSPDGKYIVITASSKDSFITALWKGTAKVWNAQTGGLVMELKGGFLENFYSASYSPDGKNIVTAGSHTKVWNAQTGSLIMELKGDLPISSALYSPDGKYIITASRYEPVKVYNAETGNLVMELKGDLGIFGFTSYSPDGKYIVTASNFGATGTIKVWNAQTGGLVLELKENLGMVNSASYSHDGTYIITTSWEGTVKVWNAQTGNLLIDLKGHKGPVYSASFSSDGKYIVTASEDNTCKMWDAKTGKTLYSFVVVDSTDYLVVDKYNHFDGTEVARKLLYYTCGTEVIDLEQLKDKLWVPNLAERIMKGETINAPKLSDLNICRLTPFVELIGNGNGYQFKITPRRGGLGETILFVNGIETKKYSPAALTKKADGYEFIATREELRKYFVAGKENVVSIKVYTKENDISSRGVEVKDNNTTKDITPPNLYGVIIGVSDYKGEELDLKYAAKDATDMANAVSISASKLLGKEHVFIYNMNTGNERLTLPEKRSIKNVFGEIGKKANANDILLIFFAGHGVVQGTKKQFYFLTADAAPSSIGTTGVAEVGISTEELTEWMNPNNIKAQKRILILDACNSGQAINQMINIGNKDQNYLAARNDDRTAEIKQIDKLNEKAGLYILAASASNQSAYELGRFSQGVLTYALLKVVKEQPEVLEENKYLNVSNWFNASAKLVTDIVRESNLRQEPQLITTTNFNIGIVDNEVLAKIQLPNEKPLFTISNFQNNDATVMDDDLGLTNYINQNLGTLARSADNKIVFMNSTFSPDAWSLVGRYDVKVDDVVIRVNMKQNNEVKNRFEIKGKKNNVQELTVELINRASEWIEKLK